MGTDDLTDEQRAAIDAEVRRRWAADGGAERYSQDIRFVSSMSAANLLWLEVAEELYGYSPFKKFLAEYPVKTEEREPRGD